MSPRLPLLTVLLLACCTPLCRAQQGGATPPSGTASQQQVYPLLVGYWVVDFDAADTKAFLTSSGLEGEELTELKHEMAADVLEFQAEKLLVHEDGGFSTTKVRIKSQDFEKRTLVAEFQHEEAQQPDEVTVVVDGDRVTMAGKQEEGPPQKFGLKRIDKQAFEKLKAEQVAEQQRLMQLEKQAETDAAGQQGAIAPGEYPKASAVPDKEGFCFSPYNNKVVDVRGIPSGTLVMDPTYPASEKKFFRVP